MGTTFIPLAASGLVATHTLVEVKTASGNVYLWTEHKGFYPSLINGGGKYAFQDWLVDGAQDFNIYGTAQTDTATVAVQNLSGNTVQRDVSLAFSKTEFIGAFVCISLWRGDAEVNLLTFTGNVVEVDVTEQQMTLSIEGFGNWSAVRAPQYDIDKSCPLIFGSVACGSTSATPCDQSYGGCLQINRFAGAVTQWDVDCPNVEMAQPPPAVVYNTGRAF